MTKTWFITGASRGFGRAWARAALERGDRVAATARNVDDLKVMIEDFGDAVLALELDVRDREAGIAAVNAAHARFGRLDVVVNNAGYGHFGFVEELSEAEARAQLETNLFGALWITQAAIPLLRAQGGGHILQVSSIGGVVSFPGLGIYHASKWALEGLTEALSAEVAGFGIRTTLIEPGGFATDWGGASASTSDPDPRYASFRSQREAMAASMTPPRAEDSVAAILAVVDAEQPPARLLLTNFAYDYALSTYAARVDTWKQWEPVSRAADVASG